MLYLAYIPLVYYLYTSNVLLSIIFRGLGFVLFDIVFIDTIGNNAAHHQMTSTILKLVMITIIIIKTNLVPVTLLSLVSEIPCINVMIMFSDSLLRFVRVCQSHLCAELTHVSQTQ